MLEASSLCLSFCSFSWQAAVLKSFSGIICSARGLPTDLSVYLSMRVCRIYADLPGGAAARYGRRWPAATYLCVAGAVRRASRRSCGASHLWLGAVLRAYLSIYRSIDLSIYRSIDLSIDLSIYRSTDLSIYLSIYIYLSVCLSVNSSHLHFSRVHFSSLLITTYHIPTHHSPTSHTSLITTPLLITTHHTSTSHGSTSHHYSSQLITSQPITAPLLTPHSSQLHYSSQLITAPLLTGPLLITTHHNLSHPNSSQLHF